MEMTISRDGLDHILDGVNDQTRVAAGGRVAKLRTTSQKRAVSALPLDSPDMGSE
jgi:hypothetical protein